MKIALPAGKPSLPVRARIPRLSRKQLLFLAAAVLLSTVAGYNGYRQLALASRTAPTLQTVPARVGPLISTLSATGSIVATRQAKLSFGSSGRLAELNVAVGDSVKAGQLLAKLDTAALQLKVATAEANLRVSQVKLQQLKDGATPEEKAAARAAYDSALAKFKEISAGPTQLELESAQSAVDQARANLAAAQARLEQVKAGASLNEQAILSSYEQARANLAAAQAKLDQLKNPSESDLASAMAQLESSRASLKNAQSKLDELKSPTQSAISAAQSAVNTAKQALTTAQDKYEMAKGDNLASSGFSSVSAAQQNYESAKANYEAKLQDLNKLLNPSALDIQAAQASLDAAQNSFNAAQAKLNQLKNPSAADLASAQAAVDQAKANLASAQAKVDQLKAGSAESDLQSAQATVDQAKATLATAESKLAELRAGPKASELQAARSSLASTESSMAQKTNPPKDTELALAEEQVRLSEISLQQAKLDLQNATLVAPFDGVIASVTPNVGEQVSGVVMTMVDPMAIRIDVTVDESDVTKLAVGQPVSISFDAAPERRMRGRVIAVAPTGTTQQGVVTYLISIAPELTEPPLPAGMTAVATIEIERKDSVLLVPNRAVRTVGRNKAVEVMADGGKTEMKTVQVGSSNDQLTEILSGLSEGDQVVIPTTTIRSSNTFGPGAPTKTGVTVIR